MENMSDNVKGNPVGKREALLADRLRLHKGYRYSGVKIFSKGDFTQHTVRHHPQEPCPQLEEQSDGRGDHRHVLSPLGRLSQLPCH